MLDSPRCRAEMHNAEMISNIKGGTESERVWFFEIYWRLCQYLHPSGAHPFVNSTSGTWTMY